MRILMLNYEFPPLGGGAGNATKYLLKEFSQNSDIELDLITSSTDKYQEEQLSKNITIYFLDVGKNNSNLSHQTSKDLLVYSWKAYFRAKNLINKYEYNLVHSFFGLPCGFLAYLLKKPYLISLRGSDVPGHNPSFQKIHKLFYLINKLSWSNANKIIANSEDLKKTALKTGFSSKIEVIPNGVDCSFYKPGKKIKNDQFRILFVGRLNKVKNLDKLMEAFAKINNSGKKIELVLVGDGPEKNNLLRQCQDLKLEDRVIFAGNVNKNELLKYYQSSTIFVLPTLNEGMSNALLEAMACGLPVICARTGGADLLVRDNGIVLDKISYESLANAIKKLMISPAIATMGKKSRMIAQSNSWKKVAHQYLMVYKRLIHA